MPKKLRYLVIHCTATPEGRQVTPANIRQWHLSAPPLGRGWKQVGYSVMILLNGTQVTLVDYDDDDEVDPWEITNGVAGINSESRHIVYVGGTDSHGNPKDTRTFEQLKTLRSYVYEMVRAYPDILIAGHNQFAKKACPSFDVPTWLRTIGVAERNIHK
jgi:N-acetylmuramoyl-L-alanine amidase